MNMSCVESICLIMLLKICKHLYEMCIKSPSLATCMVIFRADLLRSFTGEKAVAEKEFLNLGTVKFNFPHRLPIPV